MKPRKLFVAGASGATGRTLMRLADEKKADVVPHLRPRPDRGGPVDPRAAVLDLGDREALAAALVPCTTVLQLIGTMRSRFRRGDTYESSDIGTTRQLLEAANSPGLHIDHFVLLSSAGAGWAVGAYWKAKAHVESLVRDSGIPYTIVRPSSFSGEGHRPTPGMDTLTRLFHISRFRPIPIEDVAAVLLHVGLTRQPLSAVLEGDSLWALVAEARAIMGP